ncbi:gba-4, partial [Symbiodinium natans]
VQGKSWAQPALMARPEESPPSPKRRTSLQSLQSAMEQGALTRMPNTIFDSQRTDTTAHFCTRLCLFWLVSGPVTILNLLVGIAPRGKPEWQTPVRCGAVLVCSVAWALCVYAAATSHSTGLQRACSLMHVVEASLCTYLLLRGAWSNRLQELMDHVNKAVGSPASSSALAAEMKWQLATVTVCLLGWLVSYIAWVRLGGMASWQACAASAFQALYRVSWALVLSFLNRSLLVLLDSHSRMFAMSPTDVDAAYERWTCIASFSGQITNESSLVYVLFLVMVLLGMFPPVAAIFFPDSGEIAGICSDWLMPQIVSNVVHAFLAGRMLASAVTVSEKCQKAVAFVNSLQGSLPAQARLENWLLVAHMARTDAGIFIGGVKMTMSWAGKVKSRAMSVLLLLALRFQTWPGSHVAELARQVDRFLHALLNWAA